MELTEQVIKLIKLANNNPNENEANSAARLVCTLLSVHTDDKKTQDKASKFISCPRCLIGNFIKGAEDYRCEKCHYTLSIFEFEKPKFGLTGNKIP